MSVVRNFHDAFVEKLVVMLDFSKIVICGPGDFGSVAQKIFSEMCLKSASVLDFTHTAVNKNKHTQEILNVRRKTTH